MINIISSLNFIKKEKKSIFFGILLTLLMVAWGWHIYSKRVTDHNYGKVFLVFSAMLICVFLLVWAFTVIKEIGLHIKFAIISLVCGSVFILMIPAMTVPDEWHHFATAYDISNEMMGISKSANGTIKYRENDGDFLSGDVEYSQEAYVDYLHRLKTDKANNSYSDSGIEPLSAMKFQYFAPALGITIARLFRMGSLQEFLLGRLFNLLLWTAIITLAIRIIPIGKEIIFCVALLPISIQEGMSYAYDSIVISLMLLNIAMFINLLNKLGESKKEWYRRFFLYLIVSIIFFCCKGHAYFSFLIFPLLLEVLRWMKCRQRALALEIILIIVMGVVVIVGLLYIHNHTELFPVVSHKLQWDETAESYSLSYMLHHPIETIKVLSNTIQKKGFEYIMLGIGASMGWLNKSLSQGLLVSFLILLLVSTITENGEKSPIHSIERLNLLLVALISSLCVMVALLIDWTPLGSDVVMGLQGRYFLPAFPCILFALMNDRIKIDYSVKRWIPMIQIVLLFQTVSCYMFGIA